MAKSLRSPVKMESSLFGITGKLRPFPTRSTLTSRISSSDPLAKLFTRTRHDFGRFDYEDSYYWRTASSDGSRRDPARVVKFSPPGSSRDLLVFSEVSAVNELPCPLHLTEMFPISGRRSDSYCGRQNL